MGSTAVVVCGARTSILATPVECADVQIEIDEPNNVDVRLLRILCDSLARWLEAVSSTLVQMVTRARKLPGRQEVLPCCGEDVVSIEQLALRWPTHTQVNRRVCRSSDDGCFPEMTRKATMP